MNGQTVLPDTILQTLRAEFGSRWLLLLVLTVGFLLALWPHIAFSISVGEITFFKGAYDEDTYVLYPFGFSAARLDRVLSGLLTSAASLATGSKGLALVVLDAVFVPLSIAAAYVLGCVLFRRESARLLFATLLVFSSDLFTLGNAALFSGNWPSLSWFRSLFGPLGDVLVPPIDTTYLAVTRSPEPQIAYVIAFLFIAALLRFMEKGSNEMTLREVSILALLMGATPLTYAIVSLPMLALAVATSVILIASRLWKRAAVVFVLLLVAAVAAAIPAFLVSAVAGTGLVFSSRTPTITVGVLVAVPAFVLVARSLISRRGRSQRLWMSLACLALPLFLTNQQLITGLMVSTRDWERTITMPLIAVGAGLWLSVVWPRPHSRRIELGQIVTVGLVLAAAWSASFNTYDRFMPVNATSVAMARALKEADDTLQTGTTVVLDQPDIAPLLRLRLADAFPTLLDYTQIFISPLARARSSAFSPTSHSDALFRHWQLLEVTPDIVAATLRGEQASRGGYYSGFLFNICQYWYPCTDNRGVDSGLVAAAIPNIVGAYSRFLGSSPQGNYVLVETTSEPKAAPRKYFQKYPIAESSARGITARVYAMQSPP